MAILRPTWQDSPLNQVNGQLGQDWLADLEAAGVKPPLKHPLHLRHHGRESPCPRRRKRMKTKRPPIVYARTQQSTVEQHYRRVFP